MEVSDAQRLKAVKEENRKLKVGVNASVWQTGLAEATESTKENDFSRGCRG